MSKKSRLRLVPPSRRVTAVPQGIGNGDSDTFKNPVHEAQASAPPRPELSEETQQGIAKLRRILQVAGYVKDLIEKTESGEFTEVEFAQSIGIITDMFDHVQAEES